MSNSNASGGGIGFFGLLTILFIGLKLGGVITWSWLWVFSPLWLGAAIVFALWAIFFTVMAILAFFAA